MTDNGGATSSATVTITVTGTTASVAFASSVFTPSVSASVVKVEYYFDGALSATTSTAPFSYTLNLSAVTGSHTLTARAYDAANNTTTSQPMLIQK